MSPNREHEERGRAIYYDTEAAKEQVQSCGISLLISTLLIVGGSCSYQLSRMINSAIHLLLFSISPPSPQQLKNGSIRSGGNICKKAYLQAPAHFLPRNNWHQKCAKLKLRKIEDDTPTINTSSKKLAPYRLYSVAVLAYLVGGVPEYEDLAILQ